MDFLLILSEVSDFLHPLANSPVSLRLPWESSDQISFDYNLHTFAIIWTHAGGLCGLRVLPTSLARVLDNPTLGAGPAQASETWQRGRTEQRAAGL